MKSNKDFWKKNLTWWHIAGIVAGVLLACGAASVFLIQEKKAGK